MDVVLFLMALPVSRSSGVTIACFMIMPIGRGELGRSGGMQTGSCEMGFVAKGSP